MTIVSWIIIAILWTIVVLTFGIYAGRNWEDDKKAEVAPDKNLGAEISITSDTSKFDSQALEARVEALAQVLTTHQHPKKPCDHADKISDLEHSVNDLVSTVNGYNARFTRVERKAGLSV